MSKQVVQTVADALHQGVIRLRARSADATKSVVVITPSDANGLLARRTLALRESFVHVEFLTPERLVQHLARVPLALAGLRRESPRWLRSTLTVLLNELASDCDPESYWETLARPGWRRALESAILRIENAGLTAQDLRALAAEVPLHARRLDHLGLLLEQVQQRRREVGLYGAADACRMAITELAGRTTHDRLLDCSALVLGDRELTPGTHRVLAGWLARREVVYLEQPPLCNLEPAPLGIRASLPDSIDVVRVEPRPESRLQFVQQRLFAAQTASGAAPEDDSLELVRTPDEVREMADIAREVQQAIGQGVALDQIAVVMPDGAQSDVLADELRRANIPAVWLSGPPLISSPAARYLLLALDIAAGEENLRSWYEFLRQPGSLLRRRLGAAGTEGRGRWRRLLRDCGAYSGTGDILAALRRQLDQPQPADAEQAERAEADRAATRSLLTAVARLSQELAAFRTDGTPAEHAKRWSRFLKEWWNRGPDNFGIQKRLETWSDDVSGAGIPLSLAVAELRRMLSEEPLLRGSLVDPALRIVPPMALLGGSFERLYFVGMVQGRFPADGGQDALLTDELIGLLNQRCDGSLSDSALRRSTDARRLATALTAAEGRVWLCCPRTELDGGKQVLPGRLLLDVATAMLGRRATFGDLSALGRRVGSRSRTFAADPSHALDAAEHLLSALQANPRAELPRLVASPASRRTLSLLRRLTDCDPLTQEPSDWPDRIDPATLPCPGLDSEPCTARLLARLVNQPGSFFVRQLLKAYPVKPLPEHYDPLDTFTIRDRLVAVMLDAAEHGADGFLDNVMRAWDAESEELQTNQPSLNPVTLQAARDLAGHILQSYMASSPTPTGEPCETSGDPLLDGLPWRIQDQLGRINDTELRLLTNFMPKTKKAVADRGLNLILQALARVEDGTNLEAVHFLSPTAKPIRESLDKLQSAVLESVRLATLRAQLGWYPWEEKKQGSRPRLAMETERKLEQLEALTRQLEEARDDR